MKKNKNVRSADQESGVLAEITVWEDQQEFCAIGRLVGGLQGVGYTRWEVPQVAGTLISNFRKEEIRFYGDKYSQRLQGSSCHPCQLN